MRKRSVINGADRRPAEKDARHVSRPSSAGRPMTIQSAEGGTTTPRAALARHARKCTVCRHPEREAIEDDFLRWHSPEDVAEDYGIADHCSVYRHVHATGLFERRRQTIRLALEPLLERAHTVRVTAGAVISAVRLYAQLNGDGKLIHPAKTVIVHHVAHPAAPSSEPGRSNPNSEIRKLDHAPTN